MELVEHQYTEGDSITELVAFFHTKNAQLAGMSKDFNGETLPFLILCSLPTTRTKLTQTSTPTSISTTTTSPNKGWCQNCHKGFHATENCRAPRGAKEGIPYPDQEKKQGTATVAITWEKPLHLFLAYATRIDNLNMDLNTLLTSYSTLDHLVLDSGCSIHMSPCEDWFIPGTFKKLQHSQELKTT